MKKSSTNVFWDVWKAVTGCLHVNMTVYQFFSSASATKNAISFQRYSDNTEQRTDWLQSPVTEYLFL